MTRINRSSSAKLASTSLAIVDGLAQKQLMRMEEEMFLAQDEEERPSKCRKLDGDSDSDLEIVKTRADSGDEDDRRSYSATDNEYATEYYIV